MYTHPLLIHALLVFSFIFIPQFPLVIFAQTTSFPMSGSDVVPEEYRNLPRIKISATDVRHAGLTMLESSRATVITDLPMTESVKNLATSAEMAYKQMCTFFGIKPKTDWNVTFFVMKNNLPFIEAGFVPEILPPFENGFSFNYDCWLYEQPSEYYRQHLLLHEMTHSFCTTNFDGAGPTWFAESLAELLGMHDFAGEPITLGFMPPNREAVPYCGRIREIHDAIARGEARTLEEAMHPKAEDYQTNAIYYWCWALGWFLENNPNTHDEFHAMFPKMGLGKSSEEFTQEFLASLGKKRSTVEKQWLMFIATLDYNYHLTPLLFDATQGEKVSGKVVKKFQADSGWQNTDVHVQKGMQVQIRAKGRFNVFSTTENTSWECEPNGITIEYINGQPRGILQAVILPDSENITHEMMNDRQTGTFYTPIAVGSRHSFTVPFSGTILLRLNTKPSEVEQNEGEFITEISVKE